MKNEEKTAVVVVGGGLVGLSSAMFLARQDVPVILIEKHPGSSPHPRAIGYTQRTMELFRAVGLANQVPEAPANFRLLRAKVKSLAGEWLEQTPWTPGKKDAAPVELSPCLGAAIAQDKLEPILREHAKKLGADVRLETELTRFEQDDGGVTAWVKPKSGEEHAIRAQYLIAADGFRSPIREALKIGRTGQGHLRTLRSVLFKAPLQQYLEKGVSQFEIEQPGFSAFLTTYGDGRWVLMFADDAAHDDAALRQMIAKAIGRDDLPVEIITTGRWELSARIADTFRSGRVFLAGDAAHTLPPTRGGYGANTGIEDAHNLAWKLAAVLSGKSSPALFDTYDAERRPVAWLRHDQTFARPDYSAHARPGTPVTPILAEEAIELGQLYRSASVIGAPPELPAAKPPPAWAGQPGTRAPHAWVTVNGAKKSTLDLLQGGWVLLAFDERWRALASGLGLTCLCAGSDFTATTALHDAFGVSPSGASLIRPDGYVAFRSVELAPDPAALTAALKQVSAAVA